MRLNKFISESGLCSRREADRYIERGLVLINGRKATIGDQVQANDRVTVNGHELEPHEGAPDIFIALNKPVGIVSTTDETTHDNIVHFVNHSTRIFPVGRLDKDSQGLIFLTNNGDLVNKILRAGNHHEKEYIVTVSKPLTDAVIAGMSNGVPMLGVTTRKCKIVKESPTIFRITLVQGLNRQIRRMCEHYGYDVLKLERVRIMNITIKGLPVGDWRELTDDEKKKLYSMLEGSTSEKVTPKNLSDNRKENRGSNTASSQKPHKNNRSPQADKSSGHRTKSSHERRSDKPGSNKKTISGTSGRRGKRR